MPKKNDGPARSFSACALHCLAMCIIQAGIYTAAARRVGIFSIGKTRIWKKRNAGVVSHVTGLGLGSYVAARAVEPEQPVQREKDDQKGKKERGKND